MLSIYRNLGNLYGFDSTFLALEIYDFISMTGTNCLRRTFSVWVQKYFKETFATVPGFCSKIVIIYLRSEKSKIGSIVRWYILSYKFKDCMRATASYGGLIVFHIFRNVPYCGMIFLFIYMASEQPTSLEAADAKMSSCKTLAKTAIFAAFFDYFCFKQARWIEDDSVLQ